MRAILGLILLLGVIPASAEGICALETPCSVGDGSQQGEYALRFPTDWDGETALKPLMFLHGHNSSMKSTIRSGGLAQSFVEKGFVLIAPNGNAQSEGTPRRWPGTPDPDWRDDRSFLLAVLDDVAAQVPLEGSPVISGFSAGGSMAWMMACYHGTRFGALISVAGALREPNPHECDMTPRALHIHGFKDAQVPFEGRGIRAWHQGNVFETLARFRMARACRSNPDAIHITDDWRSRVWTGCGAGDLAYIEHNGGHGLPRGWSDLAYDWLDSGDVPAN